MNNRPIGMFDSGVGGMTVFKELISTIPNEDVIYIGDTASFPYGSKSKETIIELSKRQVEHLIEKGVKLIVIACGTATSQALEELQSMYDIPMIGIIEPTVEYLKTEGLQKVGVIATVGSIRSKGWKNAIEKEIPTCLVQDKACALLAPMAEEGWTDNEIARLTIHEYVKDFQDVQALVLGCTHYPLFQKLIQNELTKSTQIINTGEMVSRAVKTYLVENDMKHEKGHQAEYQIYLTDTECNFLEVAEKLLEDKNILKQIQKI